MSSNMHAVHLLKGAGCVCRLKIIYKDSRYSTHSFTHMLQLVTCPECKKTWEYIEASIEHGKAP